MCDEARAGCRAPALRMIARVVPRGGRGVPAGSSGGVPRRQRVLGKHGRLLANSACRRLAGHLPRRVEDDAFVGKRVDKPWKILEIEGSAWIFLRLICLR